MEPAATKTIPVGRASAGLELSVETISDYQSLVALEPVWNGLVEEAGIVHPFLRHEWVRTWWECFGAGKELHTLVVKAGREVVAIAPLMRSLGRMYGLKVRRMQCIYNDHTPRLDFIVARWPNEAYRAIWNSLIEQRGRWDVLELNQLPSDSRMLREFPQLAAADGFRVGLWPSAASPYVPVVSRWEDYFKDRSSKHRSNLRNRFKRLSRVGDPKLEVVSSVEGLEKALEDGVGLEAAAWKGNAGTAIGSQPDVRRFYKMLAERAAERGWLRLQFLTVNGRRIAFGYSLCYKNRLYLLKPGYDPQYAAYSPCNLLCYLVLRGAFEHRLAEYDFVGLDDQWKLEWTKHARPHYWLFAFPNVPRARFLYYSKFRLIPRLKHFRSYRVARDLVVRMGKRFQFD